MAKVKIIGAGLAGCSCASILADSPYFSQIDLYEQIGYVGGLCCDNMGKKVFQYYGPHIFHTSNPKIIEFVLKFSKWKPFCNRPIAVTDKGLARLPISIETVKDLKGVKRNFNGFKALCSDDQRFNIYHNLIDCVPMISHYLHSINFHQNQGDRKDGNAVLYNKDCSWKKSFALKMMMPQAVAQKIVQEKNRILFRENIETAKLYPPICLGDKEGNIIGEVKW